MCCPNRGDQALGLGEVEAVSFDAVGTLFEVCGSVGQIYSTIACRYGVFADPEALDQSFSGAFRARSAQGLACSGIHDTLAEERRWWFEIVEDVFSGRMPKDDFHAYFDEVFEFFRTANAWRLYPDTLPCLGFMRGLGYRLGIISNFDSRLMDLLANLGIDRFFAEVTLSWNAGAAKPDPQIFLKAVDAMGITASMALHVGDSLEEDFDGACRAGMQAILLDRKDKYGKVTNIPRVRSLSELTALLRK